jgi:hypothetical protein
VLAASGGAILKPTEVGPCEFIEHDSRGLASALTMALNIAFLGNINTHPNHLARLDQQPYDRIIWACITGTNGRKIK